MDLLAGATFASCGVYLLLSFYFGLLTARRASDPQSYGLFSASCMFAACFAYCNGCQAHATLAIEAARWGMLAWGPALLAASTLTHVCVRYAGLDTARSRWRKILFLNHAIAVVLTLIASFGLFHDRSQLLVRTTDFGTMVFVQRAFAARWSLLGAEFVLLSNVVLGVAILVRAWLRGKREALLAVCGGAVVACSAVNDMLVVHHVWRSLFVTEYGFAAFAFGLSYTLLARHERRSEQLVRKWAELRRRSSELRIAYEALRAAQEDLLRREQLALVGELAAVVSHEIRNPLAIISNAVAGLRRTALAREDHETLLGILEEESGRLNRIVSELLSYTRPMQAERVPVDLGTLIERASELARTRSDVEVRCEGTDVSINGDPDLLRRLLDNLVENACQAMPQGGIITMRATTAVENDVAGVRIEVVDTGEGMNTQVRSRAGMPFFTTRPQGTGLGLAICNRIVACHGGALTFASGRGEGTIVTVFLPVDHTDKVQPASMIPPSPRPPSIPALREMLWTPPPGERFSPSPPINEVGP